MVEYSIRPLRGRTYLDRPKGGRTAPVGRSSEGATGFDAIVLREEAGRGLLATLNRGTVNLIGKKNYQSAPALAMAA